MSLLNALSVDVEDYYHVSAFDGFVQREAWGEFESRIVHSTHKLLNLLERRNTRATFFVLGWVADRNPPLIRDIQAAGHEIGSHSYWHRLVYKLDPKEFRDDLRRSRDVLESITGRPVTSYRAPSFSITNRSRWALEILVEEGFRLDSSIFPIYHDRYGIPGACREIHKLETGKGPLWEFPPSVLKVGPMSVPCAGGGYFRLYPAALTRFCLRRVLQDTGHPLLFYIHPWELDPDQPRLAAGSVVSRLRHYINLASTEQKLDDLLRHFPFGKITDVLSQASVTLDSAKYGPAFCVEGKGAAPPSEKPVFPACRGH